jgi:hypothetical protein
VRHLVLPLVDCGGADKLSEMGEPHKPSPQESLSQDTADVLGRILHAVEKDRRTRWLEIATAVVLSVATTASAWCAYESTRWSGVQTFRLAAANRASRDSSAATLAAMQARSFDGTMLISYLEARTRGDKELEKLLYERFRPETKNAVTAWLKLDPLKNPDAPLSPFKMAEYVQPELAEAELKNEFFEEKHEEARHANHTADTYVLLTVLFASVMFFGGICGTFDSYRLRVSTLGISVALLSFTLIALATMPVCWE